jgi:hypothetical protein
MKEEIYESITKKKEFSQLPRPDVEIAYSSFEKRQTSDEEKIRLTRELLHKVFGAFLSRKLLSPKKKNFEWILKKDLDSIWTPDTISLEYLYNFRHQVWPFEIKAVVSSNSCLAVARSCSRSFLASSAA